MDSAIKFSLVASSIRPDLWGAFLKSLEGTQFPYEVIFVGDVNASAYPEHPNLRVIETKVKPAQCYEIGFRAAAGEWIHWTADDAEYGPGVWNGVWRIIESMKEPKTIYEFTTVEDGKDCTDHHHLIGGRHETPVMAPFGIINADFLKELGGYDRRFMCGQSENDLVMRAMQAGGKVQIMPYKVFVEHTRKHQGSRGSAFRATPTGYYAHDRKILEGSWILPDGKISQKRLDAFEPFEDEGILEATQSHKGKW